MRTKAKRLQTENEAESGHGEAVTGGARRSRNGIRRFFPDSKHKAKNDLEE